MNAVMVLLIVFALGAIAAAMFEVWILAALLGGLFGGIVLGLFLYPTWEK